MTIFAGQTSVRKHVRVMRATGDAKGETRDTAPARHAPRPATGTVIS
eukprot:CAMPEP_0115881538 /NCGR_PEP_ID=MMETSP0287-20121206/28491_1 /TAXON_ID=412157 /ORGANISM="Chrysochromulina rotalis, Strain UIO044" /LENGTH=46 /DNA_ID= /DNA_START= /DNA_END= /DNA_ORIENTATION=